MSRLGVDVTSINREVMMLFKKYQKSHKSLTIIPMQYDKLAYRPEILFIGLNPSFDEKKNGARIAKFWNDNSGRWGTTQSLVSKIYKLENIHSASPRDIFQIKHAQRLAKEFYPYFKPLRDFAKKKKAGNLLLWKPGKAFQSNQKFWEHIDLFFERRTNSRDLDSLKSFETTDGNFVFDQVSLTCRIIKRIKPHNIVILSGRGSDLFQKYCSLWMKYVPKLNCREIKFENMATCRVFYSIQWFRHRNDAQLQRINGDKKHILKNLSITSRIRLSR